MSRWLSDEMLVLMGCHASVSIAYAPTTSGDVAPQQPTCATGSLNAHVACPYCIDVPATCACLRHVPPQEGRKRAVRDLPVVGIPSRTMTCCVDSATISSC